MGYEKNRVFELMEKHLFYGECLRDYVYVIWTRSLM